MNLFHGLQLLLAALVIALVVSRLRELCFESALDSVPFRRALLRWMEEDEDRAVRLVARARPAWVAVCLWPLFDPELDDLERSVEVEERLMDVSAASVRGMRALRLSASIASAFGFVVAAAHIWWVFNGDHGLRALQAGLVEGEGP